MSADFEIEVDYDGTSGETYRELWLAEWAKQDPVDRRARVFMIFEDLVAGVLYYDRKECESLGVGAIEWSVRCGDMTVEELIVCFGAELAEHLL